MPFDVGCARCGHDLRGLTEPKCPACALEFDWAEAVPIEELTCGRCDYHLYGLTNSRCPECGSVFDWEDALAEYHRRRLPYFEYRWRDRPVRSLFGTWWRALRPRRFWRNMNLHDPPRPGPLCTMVGLSIIVFFTVLIANEAILGAFWQRAFAKWNALPYGFSDFTATIVSKIADLLSSAYAWNVLITYVTWLATSFLALLVFQESMRLGKIRQAQVMRVWAYSTPFVAPLLILVSFAVYLISLFAFGARAVGSVVGEYAFIVGVSGSHLVFVAWALRCGYRDFLQMPHALVVAVSSQIIAILGSFAIVDVALGFGISAEMVRFAGRWLGYW